MKLPNAFLPVPEGGRFNFNSFPYEGLQGREFRFVTDPGLSGATLVNVIFKSNGYRPWMVLMDPKRAMTGVRLPLPPGGFQDRTRLDGYSAEEVHSRARLIVQAIGTRKADGSTLDLRTLAEAEEASLARLSDFAIAISEHNHGLPQVVWLDPKREGNIITSIDHTTTVRVQIHDFHINRDPADDGHVLLSFQGGIGCAGQQVRETVGREKSPVDVSFRIPPGCRGDQVRMTASLVNARGAPLSPPVASSLIVNIN